MVEYREVHGLFMTVEDIQKVEGIGKGTFKAIRYYISVD
ncbi:ComEA family DNA-binding protein [Thermodesulfobacteriota bacterium]